MYMRKSDTMMMADRTGGMLGYVCPVGVLACGLETVDERIN